MQKLIVLDCTVDDIQNSIACLLLADNLDVAINRNAFPFRHRLVFADLLEGDRLSLYEGRVRARRKRDMRFGDDVLGYPAFDILA